MRIGSPVHVLAAAALLAALASCATPTPTPPPLPTPALDPAGPLQAKVGSLVHFDTRNLDGPVVWSVNGSVGGSAAVGTVADGDYQAPARVPTDPVVTVAAALAADPARLADAKVTITAPGTLYVLDAGVYVYNDMDGADGDIAPDRTFQIDGVDPSNDYYGMVVAPSHDAAFIGVQQTGTNVFRVDDVSSASGAVTATGFSTSGRENPAGLAYDVERDILYVATEYALLAYDDASTAPDGKEPDRVLAGPTVELLVLDYDTRVNLDVANDRLFVSNNNGQVGVYDNASAVDGDVAPERLVELDAAFSYIWGAAYDARRDELYLADQSEEGVFVIATVSSIDGMVAPARHIAGAATQLVGPSQASYDLANDRLVVIDADADDIKVFDAASTLDGDVAPSRVIGGASLPIDYPYGGYLDPSQ